MNKLPTLNNPIIFPGPVSRPGVPCPSPEVRAALPPRPGTPTQVLSTLKHPIVFPGPVSRPGVPCPSLEVQPPLL